MTRSARIKPRKVLDLLPTDPLESARAAGLRYIRPGGPGIRRVRAGRSFRYTGADGKPLRDPDQLERIRSLVIPPAWEDVWICPVARGHLQAVGRDARGRRQYRYHPEYRKVRDETKFGRMVAFAAALPVIRKHVAGDLSLPGLPKNKVLATVVRLLETTFVRVGNDEYAKENNSYGLTTLKDRHVEISGTRLRFCFRGKSGQVHDVELTDRRLAGIVRQCRDLPGYELFQYVDESGQPSRVDSEDVNLYLRGITGQGFSAKDFRTWAGTILAARALLAYGECRFREVKQRIAGAVKTVATQLGNRPATCRKYYVHPAVLDAYEEGVLVPAMNHDINVSSTGLRREELCVLALIQQHIERESQLLKKSA